MVLLEEVLSRINLAPIRKHGD